VEESFAKEFTIGGVNQSMGRQNFFEGRERLRGGAEKAAAREFVALFPQAALEFVDRTISEAFCFGLHA
jgi:hypothetical protein